MGGMYGILIQNFSGYNNEDLKNLPPPHPREDKELEQPDEASVSDHHREGERLVPAIPSHQQRPVIPDFRENHPSSKQIECIPQILLTIQHAMAVDDS